MVEAATGGEDWTSKPKVTKMQLRRSSKETAYDVQALELERKSRFAKQSAFQSRTHTKADPESLWVDPTKVEPEPEVNIPAAKLKRRAF